MSGGQPIKNSDFTEFSGDRHTDLSTVTDQHSEQKQDIVFDAARRKKRKLPQGGEAQFGGVGDTGIDTIQFAAPISPTFYTESPQGTVIVQNHVTINIQGVEFREFDKDMKALIGELRRSAATRVWRGRGPCTR
jgi:hypothetical protein